VFLIVCWRSRSFRTLMAKVLMSRWKLLREIIRGFRQLTFIGTFEMLIGNNIPIADALDTSARTLKNTPHEKNSKRSSQSSRWDEPRRSGTQVHELRFAAIAHG